MQCFWEHLWGANLPTCPACDKLRIDMVKSLRKAPMFKRSVSGVLESGGGGHPLDSFTTPFSDLPSAKWGQEGRVCFFLAVSRGLWKQHRHTQKGSHLAWWAPAKQTPGAQQCGAKKLQDFHLKSGMDIWFDFQSSDIGGTTTDIWGTHTPLPLVTSAEGCGFSAPLSTRSMWGCYHWQCLLFIKRHGRW